MNAGSAFEAGGAAPRDPGLVTSVLVRAAGGEREALDDLVPLVYEELRAIARRQLRSLPRSATLQTTELVHEAFIKLTAGTQPTWHDRCHFFALASKAMRHLAVDHARRNTRLKRGGGQSSVTLDRVEVAAPQPSDFILAMDEALVRLEGMSPRLARVVECRFFGGLTEEETAAALAVTDRTVRRDWVKARAWLHCELVGA